MNAPLPSRATLPPKQSALPDAWIERIFDHMACLYGSKFADLWNGVDPKKVQATWAEKLAGFADKPKAIKAALDALDERPFAPSLPEFITLCRDAARRLGTDAPALTHKHIPADEERAQEYAKKAVDSLKPKVDNGIDRHWATHPRSAAQLRMIFDAAARDARFRPCITEMVEEGICTAEGKLLKRYAGMESWERV